MAVRRLLSHLDADSYPSAVNMRPSADWPDRAIAAAGLGRAVAVIERIAADVGEPAQARRGPGPENRRGAP